MDTAVTGNKNKRKPTAGWKNNVSDVELYERLQSLGNHMRLIELPPGTPQTIIVLSGQ